ncbi:serine/threonine-protein kinase RsbW [Amycolatopsis arida]|uniref:Serine/threonine-protein kinase RsbW n=1 Tax=Amycolatopsis arida TaxID=587909 RepID=A0A1I5YHQ5_9PSEU|nr:ATP-binding protein [Amycolatopsis arida]TDX90504.1 serine/threonine-protein kinase RsbW [Amycolatopsis arida]SFQ43427.1 serine/threonine-protein kinase RsbW [Amycolatopsis arida]
MNDTDPAGADDDIELRLRADLGHLPLIRSVAAGIAIRADFDLDAIADLRLAVDEACSTLITRAVPGSRMVCRFGLRADEVCFTGAVATEQPETPSAGSFGWRVLTTLADSASAWIEEDTGNGQAKWVYVQLAKRRPVVGG